MGKCITSHIKILEFELAVKYGQNLYCKIVKAQRSQFEFDTIMYNVQLLPGENFEMQINHSANYFSELTRGSEFRLLSSEKQSKISKQTTAQKYPN